MPRKKSNLSKNSHDARRQKLARAMETEAARIRRLTADRIRHALLRSRESKEARERRLTADRMRQRSRRKRVRATSTKQVQAVQVLRKSTRTRKSKNGENCLEHVTVKSEPVENERETLQNYPFTNPLNGSVKEEFESETNQNVRIKTECISDEERNNVNNIGEQTNGTIQEKQTNSVNGKTIQCDIHLEENEENRNGENVNPQIVKKEIIEPQEETAGSV